LNGQFETLLSSLPIDDDRVGAKSRVSKADVLVLAKKHIMQLEREKMMLEEQRQKLQGNVQELRRKFMEVGGVCMP
jgi:predicted nuclease with TOPRIM domain